jgi:hypothetical protein
MSLVAPLSVYQRQDVFKRSRENWKSLGETAVAQDRKTAKEGFSRQYQKLISKEGQ